MEFRPVEQLSYNDAITELENILRTIQNDNCDIDKLTAFTRRATELITECRRRLTMTDKELQSILADFSSQSNS
ncbi:MAG: exodeoxyribonuclease VII small subunit [Paramuribaculum sp.]|nr:exodeoxyribonuclease VII small subunit [Paramuribaculum sp.]